MVLEKLVIENYKQFADKQELIFSKSKSKPITLIQGPNASGKSNLVAAMKWPLYEQFVYHKTVAKWLDSKTAGQIKSLNTQAALVFSNESEKYEFTTKIRYYKQKGKITAHHESNFLVQCPSKSHDELSLLDVIYLYHKGAVLRVPNLDELIYSRRTGWQGITPCFDVEDHREFFAMMKGKRILLDNKVIVWLYLVLQSMTEEHPAMSRTFVLDCPFMRLSPEIKESFAESLLNIKQQIVVLATDAELTGIKHILAERVGKTYVLNTDTGSGQSQIQTIST